MSILTDVWRVFKRGAYACGMGQRRHGVRREERVRQPEGLRKYAGLWVAVKDGRVVAAASTSLDLVAEVHKLGAAGKGAVAQFVAPHSDSIVIGVG